MAKMNLSRGAELNSSGDHSCYGDHFLSVRTRNVISWEVVGIVGSQSPC